LIDLAAIDMVDEAYADRDAWIKKSISTTAKVKFRNMQRVEILTQLLVDG